MGSDDRKLTTHTHARAHIHTYTNLSLEKAKNKKMKKKNTATTNGKTEQQRGRVQFCFFVSSCTDRRAPLFEGGSWEDFFGRAEGRRGCGGGGRGVRSRHQERLIVSRVQGHGDTVKGRTATIPRVRVPSRRGTSKSNRSPVCLVALPPHSLFIGDVATNGCVCAMLR